MTSPGAWQAGSFPFLLSTELLREYRSVLLRDHPRDLHGLSSEQVDLALTEVAANALVREPEAAPELIAPDRGADHLWRLLATTAGAILVTGDRVLLANPPDFASVQSPRTFIDSMAGERT